MKKKKRKRKKKKTKRRLRKAKFCGKLALKNTKIGKKIRDYTKTDQKTVCGPSRGSLGRPLETLWEVLECLGKSRWGLGGVLGASWVSFRQSWGVPGRVLEGLERTWGRQREES